MRVLGSRLLLSSSLGLWWFIKGWGRNEDGWKMQSPWTAQGVAAVLLLEVLEEARFPEPCFSLSSAFQKRRQCLPVALPLFGPESGSTVTALFLGKGDSLTRGSHRWVLQLFRLITVLPQPPLQVYF